MELEMNLRCYVSALVDFFKPTKLTCMASQLNWVKIDEILDWKPNPQRPGTDRTQFGRWKLNYF